MITELYDLFTQTPALIAPHIGVAIHHTVSDPEAETEDEERAFLHAVDDYHRNVRGWTTIGIGYHALVFPSGRGYLVGKPNTQRAHIADRNHLYYGIAFVGDFSNSSPTAAAIRAGQKISEMVGLQVLGGHRDFPDQNTACPGNWNYMSPPGPGLLEPMSPSMSASDLALIARKLLPGLPDYARPNNVDVEPLPKDGDAKRWTVTIR
jgi:hypothetical protein|tara:strand:- start:161 stop:781 length:621 start_codon:yes stop_codon:yes gene_type:complete